MGGKGVEYGWVTVTARAGPECPEDLVLGETIILSIWRAGIEPGPGQKEELFFCLGSRQHSSLPHVHTDHPDMSPLPIPSLR